MSVPLPIGLACVAIGSACLIDAAQVAARRHGLLARIRELERLLEAAESHARLAEFGADRAKGEARERVPRSRRAISSLVRVLNSLLELLSTESDHQPVELQALQTLRDLEDGEVGGAAASRETCDENTCAAG